MKKRKHKDSEIRNNNRKITTEVEDIFFLTTTDFLTRDSFSTHKFENLNEMYIFLEKYRLPQLTTFDLESLSQ